MINEYSGEYSDGAQVDFGCIGVYLRKGIVMKRVILACVVGLAASSVAHAQFLDVDQTKDGKISLSELLRLIQFYNADGLHCQVGTEDGFAPSIGEVSCAAHNSDYSPQDWKVSLSELLRSIQFYNLKGYSACVGSEDGFCVGPAGEGEGEGGGQVDAPLLEVRGQVTSGLQAIKINEPLEVGVLWLNLLDDNTTVLVEATKADAIGAALPASFDASIIVPPSDKMLGVTLGSWDEGGAPVRPVEASRVAFGVVVVAPEGTLENLPSTATLGDFISGSDALPGTLLSSFTLVSSFGVRYVRNAEAEGIVLRDIQGVPYALADFTIIDLGAWARGIDNALCRDRRLGQGWASPEVQACITENAERIAVGEAAAAACSEACGLPPADDASEDEKQAYSNCIWGCTTTGDTRGNVENECLFAWFQGQSEATDLLCGRIFDYAESDFRNARRLAPGESLTLSLDEGDIRSALTAGGFIFLY